MHPGLWFNCVIVRQLTGKLKVAIINYRALVAVLKSEPTDRLNAPSQHHAHIQRLSCFTLRVRKVLFEILRLLKTIMLFYCDSNQNTNNNANE